MKSCKIVNGRLACEEDDLAKYNTQKSSLRMGISLDKRVSSQSANVSPLHMIETLMDDIPEKHKEDVRNILHPFFGNHITKPNITEIPTDDIDRAILNQAAAIYNETDLNKQSAEKYLNDNGITSKYTIDYDESTRDGLVAVKNKTNKATLVLRGTKPNSITDWKENFEFGKNITDHPLDTTYGKRIETFYNNVNGVYEIEHITGFSKGGYGALSLGDAKKTQTTLFSPAVSPNNLKHFSQTKHNIYNTTDDVISIFANPLQLLNKNVTVNTINPLKKFNSLKPHLPHDLGNYSETDERRPSHINRLSNDLINTQAKQMEFQFSRIATTIIDKNLSFNDYLSRINKGAVNLIDGSLKTNIKRNGLEHRIWKEQGGRFTMEEQQMLTSLKESTYKPTTSRIDRLDHAQAPTEIQIQETIEIQNDITKINDDIKTQHESHPLHTKNTNKWNVGLGARGVAALGLGILSQTTSDFLLKEESGLLGESILSEEITQDLTVIKETLKPVTDLISDAVATDIGVGVMSGTIAAITGGLVAPEMAVGVGAYQASKFVGDSIGNFAKTHGASEEVIKHSQMVGESMSAVPLFSALLTGISTGLATLGVIETAIPFPPIEALGLMSIGSAALVETIDAVLI